MAFFSSLVAYHLRHDNLFLATVNKGALRKETSYIDIQCNQGYKNPTTTYYKHHRTSKKCDIWIHSFRISNPDLPSFADSGAANNFDSFALSVTAPQLLEQLPAPHVLLPSQHIRLQRLQRPSPTPGHHGSHNARCHNSNLLSF